MKTSDTNSKSKFFIALNVIFVFFSKSSLVTITTSIGLFVSNFTLVSFDSCCIFYAKLVDILRLLLCPTLRLCQFVLTVFVVVQIIQLVVKFKWCVL